MRDRMAQCRRTTNEKKRQVRESNDPFEAQRPLSLKYLRGKNERKSA